MILIKNKYPDNAHTQIFEHFFWWDTFGLGVKTGGLIGGAGRKNMIQRGNLCLNVV
jgi:hypothetical protein